MATAGSAMGSIGPRRNKGGLGLSGRVQKEIRFQEVRGYWGYHLGLFT